MDLRTAEQHCGQPLVGHSGTGWTSLTTHLQRHDVSDEELLALDLAQPTRRGTLIDARRGRLVVPVTRPDGRIDGFIGRDTTGDPRAPKYRNPTRTPTFDKSTMLYTPTGRVPRDATGPVTALRRSRRQTCSEGQERRPWRAQAALVWR